MNMTHIESTCHHCIARDNCEECKEVHGQPTCLDIHCGERVGGPCTSGLQIDLAFCKAKIEALEAQLVGVKVLRAKLVAMDVPSDGGGYAVHNRFTVLRDLILAEWPE